MQMNYLSHNNQQGSALLFSIILLIALTFTAVISVQTGIMEVRMAGALQDEMEAFQTAQSAIDFVVSDGSNLPTTGAINVPIAVTLTGDAFSVETGELVTADVQLTNTCGVLPRMTLGFSAGTFFGYKWKISADVDKRATRRGRSHQRQGYIKTVLSC